MATCSRATRSADTSPRGARERGELAAVAAAGAGAGKGASPRGGVLAAKVDWPAFAVRVGSVFENRQL